MLGVIFALLTAVSWGFSAILIRLGVQYFRPTTGAWISLAPGIILVMTLAAVFNWASITSLAAVAIAWIALYGFFNSALGRVLNATSIQRAGVARATPLLSVAPFFATILAIIFLDESITPWLLLGTFSIVIGISIITSQTQRTESRGRGSRLVWLGYLAALGAAMCYGVGQVIGKHLVTEHTEPLVATGFSLVFGFIFLSIMFHRHIPADLRHSSSRLGFLWFGLSGITTATGLSLLYLALDQTPVVVVSPIIAANPLVALVLASIFLRSLERVTLRIVAGAILVVGGVIIVALSNVAS